MNNTQKTSSTTVLRLKEMVVTGLLGGISKRPGKLVRSFAYKSVLGKMGQSVRIDRDVDLDGAHYIEIGDDVSIGSNARLQVEGSGSQIVIHSKTHLQDLVRIGGYSDNSKVIIESDVMLERGVTVTPLENGSIQIGNGTYIGPFSCLAGPGHISIGKDCLIASSVGIYANNHIFTDLNTAIRHQGKTTKGIVIEDGCWLGANVNVLDGVTIGTGSIVGAGAVVTKSIPPMSIAVGVPAQVISRRADRTKTSTISTQKEFLN